MPRINIDIDIDTDDIDVFGDLDDDVLYDTGRRRGRSHRQQEEWERESDSRRDRDGDSRVHRADGQESFKCGHCRAFIGPTVSGGRHRNHCPLCLYSRHVDDRTPGDRASDCRSLMAPIAAFHRPKGEEVIVHRCLGCGLERHNRVAADDNMLACEELPLVEPRLGR